MGLPDYLLNSEQLLRDIKAAANVEDGKLDEAVSRKRSASGKRRSRSRSSRATPAEASSSANNLPHGTMYKAMCSIMKEMLNYADHHGNILITNFMELPSKQEAPEYYEKIARPLDIQTIMTRLERRQFKSVDSLENNVLLVFDNALEFYDNGSDMYEAADLMRRVFKELRARVESEIFAEAEGGPRAKRAKGGDG